VLALTLLGTIAPAPADAARPILLAHGVRPADDLAWGPHGTIYFSDFGNNA